MKGKLLLAGNVVGFQCVWLASIAGAGKGLAWAGPVAAALFVAAMLALGGKARQDLRMLAIARLFLDNITNIQSSWVTMGPAVGQTALFYGANDYGSVMFEENVVSSAGTTYCMDMPTIERSIVEAGFYPWRRNVHYQSV